MKTKLLFSLCMSAGAVAFQAQSGNVGIGTTTPGTKLDVNGAITNREATVTVASNTATILESISQVQLTGTATATVAVSVPTAPANAGQRLVIFNNTTGGFGATLNSITIPNGKALEFVYSNSGWRSTDGGAAGIQSYDWLKTGDAQPTASGDNSVNIYHMGGHVGIGTKTPVGKLHLYNSTAGTEAGNDYIIDDESPISQIQGMIIRRSNAGANLAQNDFIGSMLFNPKINGAFGYTGAGMSAIYRGDGTNALTALSLRVNSNQEAMRLDENANVGIGTTTPGTKLDVNGAITNREATVTVASNTATILESISQVQLTGTATATVAVSVPTAPLNAGQRLVIFNNTTGGFGATLNSITIPNGKALEFVYSNSGWRSTDGGAVAAAGSLINIYTADGTINSTRTVTQGANTLAFTSTATNGFSVDGSTFSVDAANNRVGIGGSAPVAKLDIVGTNFGIKNAQAPTAGSWDNLWFNVGSSISSVNASGADSGLQFNVGSNGVGTYGDGQTLTTVATMLPNGNIGIGTSSPAAKLDVTGTIKIVDGTQAANRVLTSDANGLASWQAPTVTADINIYKDDGTLTGNRTVAQGANTLAFTSTATNGFSVDGTTFSVDAANNRVGIGTAAPHAPLQLANATANRKIVMYETTDNENQFYGFGVNGGVLRYQTDVTASDHVFFAGTSATTSNELMRIKGTGNVGIGTSTPGRILEVAAATNPIRFSGLATTNSSANVLAIDASGDVRSIPFNNLNASSGSFAFVNSAGSNYVATGNESMIWVANSGNTVTLPVPSNAQVGKYMTIVASFGAVTLAGELPTIANSTTINSIASGKRITIYGIAAGTWGNATNTWSVSAKDF